MKRLFGAYPLALFAAIAFLNIALNSCSNPSNAPATSNTVSYSASAFFNTESAGDTSTVPFPFCFPVDYLQQKLGLTNSQIVAIQQVQDSLRIALKARLDALKAAGTLNPDSARAIRLEFQTELYKDVAAILTPDQLAALQALQPPTGPFDGGGHRGLGRRGGHGPDNDSARVNVDPATRDSLALVRLETVLTNAGTPLTADQITLIQNLQTNLRADTTLTPDGRRAQFEAQLETILTADQLAKLKALGDGDDRRHRRH